MTEQQHKPCPFCGGEVDPTGWMSLYAESGKPEERVTGPECNDCGATAPSMEVWNRRAVEKPVAWRFRLTESGQWTYTTREMKRDSFYFEVEALTVQKTV